MTDNSAPLPESTGPERPCLHPPPGGAAISETIAALAFGCALMGVLQSASATLAGNDSYYHVKMALLLPEIGLPKQFGWLHWTIFRDHFVSHHVGFQVLLYPFVATARALGFEPALGAKVAVCALFAVSVGLYALLLQIRRRPMRLLWLVLLTAAPWHFWLRASYVRAPVVALSLLLLGIWIVLRGRAWMMALLGFVFVHIYGGAVVFPLIAGGYLLAAWITHDERGRAWRMTLAAAGGLLAGFVLNPYFPGNVRFFYTQIFQTGLAAPSEVGSEWKPYDTWFYFKTHLVLLIVLAVALVRRLHNGRPLDVRGLGVLVAAGLFVLLTLKARRFVEYEPVLMLLAAAELWPHPQTAAAARFRRRWPAGVALVLVAAFGVVNLRITRTRIHAGHDVPAYRDAMRWLVRYSPAGSIVFTDDWDNFPVCFYFNHHNRYIVGLDPVFTKQRWPVLWERYKRITRAQVPSTLPKSMAGGDEARVTLDDIATRFEARYVLVAADHPPLYRKLRASSDRFRLVYPPHFAGKGQPAVAIFEVLR